MFKFVLPGYDVNDMSASQIEYIITKIFKYPFTRRRLLNMATNGVIDTSIYGSVQYKHSFNIRDIHWILVYILTTEIMYGVKQGKSIERKYNIFGMAKEIVDMYWRNGLDKGEADFEEFKHFYIEHDLSAFVKRGLVEDGEILKSDLDLLLDAADCYYVFDALIDNKVVSNLHKEWLRILDRLDGLQCANKYIKPEISIGTLVDGCVIDDINSATKLLNILKDTPDNYGYAKNLYVWLDVIRRLDNNTLWMSLQAKQAIGSRLKIEETLKNNSIKPKHFYLAASISAISEAVQKK